MSEIGGWSLRLVATDRPALQADADPASSLPLEALRQDFDADAAQAIFLGLRGLPDEALSPERLLPEDERARARRLVNPAVARAFVAGRWLLRSVLAAIMGRPPLAVPLRVGEHGKLFVAATEDIAPSFNLSHSGELVALALAARRRIGIDVEAARPLVDAALLARRILTASEAARFDVLPEETRPAALIAAWTGKEAVLKAQGTGIAGSMELIETLMDLTAAADELTVTSPGEPATRWSVPRLPMPVGYYGSLALEGAGGSLRLWQAVPVRSGG